ncbi:MAG: ABC transporter ATP-binding protein [Thaumarchaeota archaeon]|jgi:spermidine/putrescine transport system ATP-binding protein|nr:ABC transporter ATP-binding protein [Candidatus Geocrenenecus arthurdayi]MCL7396063.1 ABC transporter ATP-binding protein [Candidatus Geocrenenecus arthurdayi]
MSEVYSVELENVVKRFGSVVAVDHVNLKIRENEFFSLLGPSGCGKTTTLRIIAGLEEPDEGIVKLYGKDVTDIPTHKRNIGMVFQHLALFPHMNVFENIAFGLKMRKLPREEIKREVKRILEIVKLEGLENRRINQLSGGQQQRVALARALVINPEVLLLDEPLGALDLKIRQHMMVELKNIQKRVKTTFIYVTHDQTEAMTMSDRIAIMKDGRIQQVGTPLEVYYKPSNTFVASFIGEAVNLIEGEIKENGIVDTSLGVIYCSEQSAKGKVAVMIRPENVEIDEKIDGVDNLFKGIVQAAIFKGSYIEYRVDIQGITFIVHKHGEENLGKIYPPGATVEVGWKKNSSLIIPVQS